MKYQAKKQVSLYIEIQVITQVERDMSEAIQGKKRNDIEIALLSILSPIIIIGLIAKTLITEFRQPKAKQPQQKIKNTPTEQDGIEFSPIPIEDEQVIAK